MNTQNAGALTSLLLARMLNPQTDMLQSTVKFPPSLCYEGRTASWYCQCAGIRGTDTSMNSLPVPRHRAHQPPLTASLLPLPPQCKGSKVLRTAPGQYVPTAPQGPAAPTPPLWAAQRGALTCVRLPRPQAERAGLGLRRRGPRADHVPPPTPPTPPPAQCIPHPSACSALPCPALYLTSIPHPSLPEAPFRLTCHPPGLTPAPQPNVPLLPRRLQVRLQL